jgi:hypothetical protein
MERVFRDPDGADQMGQAGRATLRSHTAESVNPTLRGVLDEAIATYGTSTLAGPGRAGA